VPLLLVVVTALGVPAACTKRDVRDDAWKGGPSPPAGPAASTGVPGNHWNLNIEIGLCKTF